MKKTLVLLAGLIAIYALYVFFYRPNLLSNARLARSVAFWQFAKSGDAKLIAEEDSEDQAYLAVAPGGEICQFFLSGLIPGQVCEASFDARAKNPDGRLTFRLDGRTHAILSVTNTEWQTVKFRFPIYDYADKRSFRLVAGKNSGIDLRDFSLRRAFPTCKAELAVLSGMLVTNLVSNGEFLEGTKDWNTADENDLRAFNLKGVPTLMFFQTSNVVLTASQTVRMKKGVPYIISASSLMDDNRSVARIANLRYSYNDGSRHSAELPFANSQRGIWVKGSARVVPKDDCDLTLFLRCEHSKGKKPGKVYFHGVRVYPADEIPKQEPAKTSSKKSK